MKMNYSHKQLTEISDKSLWIIMDPVKDQESADKEFSKEYLGLSLNQWNNECMKKIFEYASHMKNKIVITNDIKDSPDFMRNYLWLKHSNQNGLTILENFIKEKKLDNIIYCGFHEQYCIVARPLGYNNMISKYNCYIEENLSCPWPSKNWRAEQSFQQTSEQYKYIDMANVKRKAIHFS